MKLTTDQHKQIIVDNLSKSQSWRSDFGDKPRVIFSIPFSELECGDIAAQLEQYLGLKDIIAVNESRELYDAQRKSPRVIVDTEAKTIEVVGDQNVQILADAGVEFPGVRFHRSEDANRKWTPSVK